MLNEKVNVKIYGSCNENPNGEMIVKYIIEIKDKEPVTYFEILESKFGNTILKAEYLALNKALEDLLEKNLAKADIVLQTTSFMIYMQSKGYVKPNSGHYISEAAYFKKLLKRFLNLNIEKVDRSDIIDIYTLKIINSL